MTKLFARKKKDPKILIKKKFKTTMTTLKGNLRENCIL